MMEDISFNGEKFVHTTINQDQMHQLYTELTFSLKPFKDYLSLSFTPSFNRYISKGIDYTHTYSYWRTRISATFNYKNYVVGIDAHSRYNNLWGEDKQYGENFHTVNLGYVSPKWSVMGILFNPFSKRYDQSSENLSKLASNTSYVYSDNLARTFAIQFTMNLNFGRKFNAGDKRLNNSDSNSGIMSGTKK